MARRYYSTTAQRTTLASSCTDSATTIVVTAATGFPSSTPFPLVLDADTVNEEAVLVTSRVGTTCTVTRAYDGTTGVAHSAGATVRHTALALDFNEASEHVFETTTAHGLTLADVITTSNTKTLTNKTLTAPTIADFTNAAHDHGDADDGGTLPASSVLNRPINAQSGTTYTFALADASKHVTGSSGSSSTFTIPLQASVTWLSDARIPVTNVGAGVMTLAITGGGTLNGSDLTIAQGESVLLLRTASDVWWCLPFSTGSGAVARGTLSGTTGSPSSGSNGGATYYEWTADGTFTVATAGLFDMLVVGGGAGGGGGLAAGGAGGGGGGGGVTYLTSVYLAAGAHTVNVGAGGAAGAVACRAANGESTTAGPIVAAGGGGGGTYTTGQQIGLNGGSGGAAGGGVSGPAGGLPASGQGYAGGAGGSTTGGGPGGGGASAAGTDSSAAAGAAGGAGLANNIKGTGSTNYGAGGGGGGYSAAGGAGGSGGGGAGSSSTGAAGTAGTTNTGGGGGGGAAAAGASSAGGDGGSGVVILLVGTV